jgi:zinc/manganese transport system substrate-binding protein
VQPTLSIAVAAVVAIAAMGIGTYFAIAGFGSPPSGGGVVRVVAAENFWGSLISQIGGARVSVTSIVTDPNVDPHDYESNPADARAIATAQLVIENGAGYDDWCSQLVAASATPHQTVLNVADLLGMPSGANPHFWYSPTYVNATVNRMYTDLTAIDPADSHYFLQEYQTLRASLAQVDGRIAEIQHRFGGTHVASTESIFVYLAAAAGLNLVSPPAFMNAISEGDDPPAQSVVEFQNQLESGTVSLMVYNLQTVTPLTEQMKAIAVQHNVPLVGVTETIQPPNVPFQTWMAAQLLNIQNALNASAHGA